jgi:hypothetical protein
MSEIRDQVAAYAAVGVQHMTLPAEFPFDYPLLERLARDVMDPLRDL